jgi:hypothetical protein
MSSINARMPLRAVSFWPASENSKGDGDDGITAAGWNFIRRQTIPNARSRRGDGLWQSRMISRKSKLFALRLCPPNFSP